MIKIRIKKYGIWLFVNFVFCLFPFVIMWALDHTRTQMFSSFLSYNFTLLVMSLYVFMGFGRVKRALAADGEFISWLTFLWIIILIALFVMYPKIPSEFVSKLFSDANSIQIALIIVVISVVLSFFLNKPYIESIVNDTYARNEMRKADDIKKNVQGMAREMEAEDCE